VPRSIVYNRRDHSQHINKRVTTLNQRTINIMSNLLPFEPGTISRKSLIINEISQLSNTIIYTEGGRGSAHMHASQNTADCAIKKKFHKKGP